MFYDSLQCQHAMLNTAVNPTISQNNTTNNNNKQNKKIKVPRQSFSNQIKKHNTTNKLIAKQNHKIWPSG